MIARGIVELVMGHLAFEHVRLLVLPGEWRCSVRRRDRVVECVCLEVQELQVVCTLVPLVLVTVEARSGLCRLLLIHLESLVNSEVQVVTHGRTILTTRCLLANIRARAHIFGS